MSKKESSGSVVVIGGGPGGYPAAFYAADKGMNVTLVDTDVNPGGVCLYRGCIPSKALLHAARVINETREAADMGLAFNKPRISVKKLREWKDSVVERLTGGVGQLSKMRKVNYIQGHAEFNDSNSITIKKKNGKSETIKFEHAIISTGSRPAIIPNIPENSKRILDSTTALDIDSVPKSLLVIGGGYIGLELGTVYSALGSKVTVIEMLEGLLPGADRDLVRPLAKRLGKEFESILLKAKVTEVKEQKNGMKVSYTDSDGEKHSKVFDKVLVAVGRKPNTDDVGLHNTKIKVNDKGFIEVDGQRRTIESNIFAIGDVAGEPMLAHKATHEALVAVEAIEGKKTVFEPMAIPAVVFTDPEVAWSGLTEEEAKKTNKKVKVLRFPWAASGRAITFERDEGVTKLVTDPKSGRILGVGITGVNAGELIAEGTLAIEMGATAEDLALTIHAHPTLSETLMEAGEMMHGNAVHAIRK